MRARCACRRVCRSRPQWLDAASAAKTLRASRSSSTGSGHGASCPEFRRETLETVRVAFSPAGVRRVAGTCGEKATGQ